MNTITIELCAEDRARLDAIIKALNKRPDCQGCVTETLKFVLDKQADEPTPTTPEEPTEPPYISDDSPFPSIEPAEVTDAADTTDAPQITKEQIQQKVVQLAASGGDKKAKVREIVHAYAPKVSDLPADKYSEIWDKLTALEKEAE